MNRQILVLMGFIMLAALFAMPAYGQTQSGEATGQSAMQTDPSGAQDAMGQGPLRASQIMGINVNDQQGNSVGTVEDLILSDQGDIEYLVLARGGVFGIGGNMVPVPWQMVSAEGADALKLNIDQERLENAPSFSKSDWNQMAPADFDQQVRGYYGVEEQPANEPYKPGIQKRENFGEDQQMQ